MANYKVNITGLDTSTLKTWSSSKTLEEIARYKKGECTIDDIVINNLRLVLSCLHSIRRADMNMDDLFQVGVLGLIKAINNFDLQREVMFSTYAYPMIKGEIRRFVRDNVSVAKVSRQIYDLAYKIMNFQEEYLYEYGSEAPLEAIENHFSIKDYEIKEALDSISPISYLSDTLIGDEDITLYDIIPSEKHSYEKQMNRISLREGISHLDDIERDIINYRYYMGLTQSETSKKLKISQAQISRLETKALKKLRKYF